MYKNGTSIHFLYSLSYTRSWGALSHEAQSHTHSHAHSDTTDNLEMQISLKSMSLDCRSKSENQRKPPKARGEDANSVHAGRRWGWNPLPPKKPRRCNANILTTNPQCPRSLLYFITQYHASHIYPILTQYFMTHTLFNTNKDHVSNLALCNKIQNVLDSVAPGFLLFLY